MSPNSLGIDRVEGRKSVRVEMAPMRYRHGLYQIRTREETDGPVDVVRLTYSEAEFVRDSLNFLLEHDSEYN